MRVGAVFWLLCVTSGSGDAEGSGDLCLVRGIAEATSPEFPEKHRGWALRLCTRLRKAGPGVE